MNNLRSGAYWVGHFFTIIATIIGIYYASIVGLETGVKLEMIQADRGTYYVASSLYSELESNIERMDESIKLFDKRKFSKDSANKVRFNDFIFQSAKYSDSTFEIEPEILTGISEYYFTVQGLIHDYKFNNLNHVLMIVEIKKATEAFKAQKIMEKLSAYNKALAKSIENRGVNLSQPAFSL